MAIGALAVLVTVALAVATVSATTSCPSCVYTQGYVKTHGPLGPAPYDPTWDEFGQLMLCGTYDMMTVLTNCQSITTNVHWCNVARQLVAVKFNLLKGQCDASTALAFNATLRAAVLNDAGLCVGLPSNYPVSDGLVSILSSYNEGTLPGGPCHCGDANCVSQPEPVCHLTCNCSLSNETNGGGGGGGQPQCVQFCTLTRGAYRNRPEWCPAASSTFICGMSLPTIWSTPTNQGFWYQLASQYGALWCSNQSACAGSCLSDYYDEMAEAYAILTSNCANPSLALPANITRAIELSGLFDLINNGNTTGIEHCPGGPCTGTVGSNNGGSSGPQPMQCTDCSPILDCCPADAEEPSSTLGCTLDLAAWAAHPELWVPSPQSTICSITLATIATSTQTGQWWVLARAYLEAYLSSQAGAYTSPALAADLALALQTLLGSCGSSPDYNLSQLLATRLHSFAAGFGGVPYCGSDLYVNTQCTKSCPSHVCNGGCTRSPGYWKNKCPAEFDDPNRSYCGVSWCTLLSTPPKGGNVTLIVLFQYIAARENIWARGACAPASIVAAIQRIETQLATMPCGGSMPSSFLADATILSYFNEGQIGPGSCDIVALVGGVSTAALSVPSEQQPTAAAPAQSTVATETVVKCSNPSHQGLIYRIGSADLGLDALNSVLLLGIIVWAVYRSYYPIVRRVRSE